jgi:hypothetical protein
MSKELKNIFYATVFALFLCSLSSCHGNKKASGPKENLVAKQEMQGIWVDDDTESPLMRIKGDSIYYADIQTQPVSFKVINDTLFTYGNATATYKIIKRMKYTLCLQSGTGEQMNLHKSEDPTDISAFTHKAAPLPVYNTQVKRDSVVMFDNVRYRAYTYINPSRKKVVCSSVSEDGFQVDNVYYDNVMHICVYKGAQCLYGSDINKNTFGNLVSDDFLAQAILADMRFTKVSKDGFHYQATLQQPESYISSIIELVISFEGKLSMNLLGK